MQNRANMPKAFRARVRDAMRRTGFRGSPKTYIEARGRLGLPPIPAEFEAVA